jgi:hypothetical protein
VYWQLFPQRAVFMKIRKKDNLKRLLVYALTLLTACHYRTLASWKSQKKKYMRSQKRGKEHSDV